MLPEGRKCSVHGGDVCVLHRHKIKLLGRNYQKGGGFTRGRVDWGLLDLYMHTKFKVSSFSSFRDIKGLRKSKSKS